jgi:hypothetical protein
VLFTLGFQMLKRRKPGIAQEAPLGYSPERVGVLLKRTGRTIRK